MVSVESRPLGAPLPPRIRGKMASAVGLLILGAAACATPDGGGDRKDSDAPAEARAARGNDQLQALVIDDARCVSAGKRVSQIDLNHDEFADLITVYANTDKGEIVGCKQADLNFDGRLDAFYYYGPEGEIEREQFDLDFDGRIDLGRYFEGEIVAKDEQDLDLDGAVDTWRFYDKGRIVRMETDRDADGRPDMFTYYVSERIDRIGYDVNGDGKADQWDHDAARRARIALEKRREAQAPPKEDEDDAETVEEPTSEDGADKGANAEESEAGSDGGKKSEKPSGE